MIPQWAQRISDLLDTFPEKSAAGLARACGIKQGSVSGWLGGGKPTKMISGDNLVAAAAYLETTPEYIMTGRHPARLSESQPVGLDLEMLRSSIVSVKEALRAMGLELDAFLAAPMIAYAYTERVLMPRTMTKAEYRAFDDLITARLKGELGHDVVQGGAAAGSEGSSQAATASRKAAGSRH